MFGQLEAQFEKLTQREKYLVILTGVILILFVGFTAIIEPKYLDNDRTSLEIANKQIELKGVEQKVELLKAALADDPNASLQKRIDSLQQRIEQLDASFATQLAELIPAQQMPMVIEQMLQQADQLTLLELNSIPPVNLFADDEQNADLTLYQHGVQFVFEGQYPSVLAYLETVESFPWQVYWRSLDYQVADYPNASVTIELYTLSTSRAFMGVQ